MSQPSDVIEDISQTAAARLTGRSSALMFAAQLARLCLTFVSVLVLARLVSPREFGLVAMVSGVVGFVEVIKDAGLSMATVQRAQITRGQVATLFWLNVALGLVLTLVVAALGPLLSFVFEEELSAITAVLALSFVFSGAMLQHQALLWRRMKFGRVALATTLAPALGLAAAIAAALNGWGYWALVLRTVATAFLHALLIWVVDPWLPGLPRRGTGIRSMLSFGGGVTAANVWRHLILNADVLLVGWYWGAQELGFYSRAQFLMRTPVNQIYGATRGAVLSALSRMQHDGVAFRHHYLAALRTVTLVQLPMCTGLVAFGPETVVVLLGQEWAPAGDIVRVLALSAVFQPPLSTAGWLFLPLGRARALVRYGAVFGLVILLSVAVGLPFGVLGVALGHVSGTLIALLPCTRMATADTAVTLGDVMAAVWKPIVAAAVAGAAAFGVGLLVPGATLTLAVGVVLVPLLYLGVLRFALGMRVSVAELRDALKGVG